MARTEPEVLTPALTIQRKRDGEELTPAQIRAFIAGLASGEVTDYQATAFLMAVYFQGMTLTETVALTEAMLASGDRVDLSAIPGPKVDKHSTGGVGDKVSLILAPLAAACGLIVPMMSGRGLGHSGGTLDKLESIPGFDVKLDEARFKRILGEIGCAMIGQTERIAPADKKLYALRDVTATVECIPLITASILSKKLAEGTETLILDVKTGSGAFMKSRAQAHRLAKTLVQVGKRLGLQARAMLTSMDQPLGYAVGNSLEVIESIAVLTPADHPAPKYPEGFPDPSSLASADLRELTVQLCAQMLEASGKCRNLAEARRLALSKLVDGSALRAFTELVRSQGGDAECVRDLARLPLAAQRRVFPAPGKGYLSRIDTQEIGNLLIELGGGRKRAADAVDPAVGFVFHKKLGARVRVGEALVTVYGPASLSASGWASVQQRFENAISLTGSRKLVPKLILETVV